MNYTDNRMGVGTKRKKYSYTQLIFLFVVFDNQRWGALLLTAMAKQEHKGIDVT